MVVIGAAAGISVAATSGGGTHHPAAGPITTAPPTPAIGGSTATLPPDTAPAGGAGADSPALSNWLDQTSDDAEDLSDDLSSLSQDASPNPADIDYTAVASDAQLVQSDVADLVGDGPPPGATIAAQWSKVLTDVKTAATTLVTAAGQTNATGVTQGFAQMVNASKEFAAFATTVGEDTDG